MTATERMTASVDPFVLTAPVRPGQTAGLLAVDALPALALLAAASSLVTAGGAALGGIAAAGAVAAIGAGIAMLARTGQSLGGLAARVRIVDRGTGAATGAALLPRLLTGRLRACDLRRGRDPFAPALAPFEFADPPALPPNRPMRGAVPVIELDCPVHRRHLASCVGGDREECVRRRARRRRRRA